LGSVLHIQQAECLSSSRMTPTAAVSLAITLLLLIFSIKLKGRGGGLIGNSRRETEREGGKGRSVDTALPCHPPYPMLIVHRMAG
jgi:hypothetical protein